MSEITDRKNDYNECYSQSWTAFGNWQTHARDDIYSVVDNAWTKRDIEHMKKVMPEREVMSFPLLRRYVRLLSNFERNNRTSIRYEPVEGSDQQTGAQLTFMANNLLARGGYHAKSDAFEGGLKTGLNLLNMSMDRNHKICFERFAYNQFILHPSFSKRDISDCQYGILRKPVTSSEAKMFFPDQDGYINWLLKMDKTDDDKFPNMPKIKLYGQYLLNLDEWTRRIVVKKKYFVHSQLGYVRDSSQNKVEYTGSERENFMLANDPMLDVVEEYKRSVEVTQYLNGEEVYHGVDPFGIGDFSFTPYFGYFDPEVEHFHLRIQSVVRGLKDSQRTFDRRTIANIRTLEAVIGSGLDVEENAMVDPNQAFTAGSGVPRFFKEGAITEQRFRDRPAPNIPAGWLQMQEVFEKLPGKILNLNEDGMFGVDQKDQLLLGVVGKMRLGLGMIGMFDFFDNKAYADRVLGTKLLRMIQQIPADKIMRILNEEISPMFFNRDTAEYDVVSAETVLTDTQRNALYTELLNLKKMGAEIGQPFPADWGEILEFAPTAMKHKLLQRMSQREKQQQAQQQKSQQLQEAVQTAALQQIQTDTQSERVHIGERHADLKKTQVDTAKVMQEMGYEPRLEMLDRAIEMAKVEAIKEKNNASSNSKNRD